MATIKIVKNGSDESKKLNRITPSTLRQTINDIRDLGFQVKAGIKFDNGKRYYISGANRKVPVLIGYIEVI